MRQFFPLAIALVGFAASGCSADRPIAPEPSPVAMPTPATPPIAPRPAAPPQLDPYAQALDRAMSAANVAQAAASQDDWRLVASRWQQAIDLLKTVPASSPVRAQAQGKIAEYQQNLAYAQRQANRSTALRNPDGRIVVSRPRVAPPAVPSAAPESIDRAFRAPILRRAGGTPVIAVTFNGSQPFEMIVDTGASGTLITPRMAAALNVVPVGQAVASTASAANVTFPLGYVRSIEVDGAVAENMLVAVSGPELDIGLLGHDFFGNFDVTIRQDMVEFRPR